MIRKDGARWWGLFGPVRLSGSGASSECMEFIIDITDRKLVEAELAAAMAQPSGRKPPRNTPIARRITSWPS